MSGPNPLSVPPRELPLLENIRTLKELIRTNNVVELDNFLLKD